MPASKLDPAMSAEESASAAVEPQSATLSAFHPTRWRLLFSVLLAVGGFILPQEVPLVWYPLNEPGNDILYLELKCASDKEGDVQIFYNLTNGINQLDSIYFPIAPSQQTFTYTFPLPDAPITELRVDPVSLGGTLTIERMRIIDRKGQEYRRFTYDHFRPQNQIASIDRTENGWSITSMDDATDPFTRIEMFSPIVAKDLNHRNLLRCLLSWGYLSLMLWIILLAGLFTFWRPTEWRALFPPVGFMAILALLFSAVGNRGLIKNSWHYSRFQEQQLPPGLNLEIDLNSSSATHMDLFWDIGRGMNGDDLNRQFCFPGTGLQTVRFPLPKQPLKDLRYDPRDNAGVITIHGIRLVDAGQRTHSVLPLESLASFREIQSMNIVDLPNYLGKGLRLETTLEASDPILGFTSTAVAQINQTVAKAAAR